MIIESINFFISGYFSDTNIVHTGGLSSLIPWRRAQIRDFFTTWQNTCASRWWKSRVTETGVYKDSRGSRWVNQQKIYWERMKDPTPTFYKQWRVGSAFVKHRRSSAIQKMKTFWSNTSNAQEKNSLPQNEWVKAIMRTRALGGWHSFDIRDRYSFVQLILAMWVDLIRLGLTWCLFVFWDHLFNWK